MINFALYLFSFASNTLIVMTAPEDLLRGYVLVYNAASVIFSVFFFIYFSRFANVTRSIFLIVVATLILAAAAVAIGWYEVCIVAYPGLLIFADYLVTQSHSIRVVTIFRLLQVVSAVPFVLMPDDFAINMAIRVAVLATLSLALASSAKESHLLSVKSPIRFQVGNYAFYNGTLSLVALLVPSPEALRWWYLSIQIGLVLVLKVLDYSLRRAYSLDDRTRWFAMTAAGTIPLVVFGFYPNLLALGLFYVGFAGLAMTGRYISI